MGRTLTPAEELQQLRDTIREAHEVLKDLRGAIREAKTLTLALNADYQAHHDREIKQLANALAIEQNQASAELNESVERAHRIIRDQIMAGEAVFYPDTSTVKITFGPGKFDDQQPPPYPDLPPKEYTL